MAESFSEKEIVHYPNGGKSIFYTSGVRGKVILQSQGKEFFTWHGKDFFT